MAQNFSSRPTAHMRKCQKFKVCNIFIFHSLNTIHNLNQFHHASLSTRQANVCFLAVSEFYQLVLFRAQSSVNDHPAIRDINHDINKSLRMTEHNTKTDL